MSPPSEINRMASMRAFVLRWRERLYIVFSLAGLISWVVSEDSVPLLAAGLAVALAATSRAQRHRPGTRYLTAVWLDIVLVLAWSSVNGDAVMSLLAVFVVVSHAAVLLETRPLVPAALVTTGSVAWISLSPDGAPLQSPRLLIETAMPVILVAIDIAVLHGVGHVLRRSERALEAASRHRLDYLEASPDPTVATAEGIVVYANPAACSALGSDVVGQALTDRIHSDSSRALLSSLSAEPGSAPIQQPVRIGSRFFDVTTAPSTFGRRPVMMAYLVDVTSRLEAERLLDHERGEIRRLFNRIPVALYRSDPGGRVLEANPALADLLGMAGPEAVVAGIDAQAAYTNSDVRAKWKQRMDVDGVVLGFEQEMIRPDGSRLWVEDSARVVRDAHGAVRFYEGALIDVTQRRTAQASRARLSQILEATPDYVLVTALDGTILFANRSFRELHTSEVVGSPLLDLLPSIELRKIDGILSHVAQRGQWTGDATLVSSTGRVIPVSTVVQAHRDDSGDVAYYSFLARDMTDLMEAHHRLEQLVRSKDEFVASVSHELRTPLTAVVGLAQELRDGLTDFEDAELRELLEVLADQSAEVANIVEDLLVAARADVGLVSITVEEVPVAVQVHAALGSIRNTDNVRVTGDPHLVVRADGQRLRQILRNLVTNGDRYGGDNIEITWRRRGGMVILEVADDGPGVPEEDRERIFEAYQRAHEIPTQPNSVGLGLAVSRQLARLMGGDVEYSREGRWSTFRLLLPGADEVHRSVAAG